MILIVTSTFDLLTLGCYLVLLLYTCTRPSPSHPRFTNHVRITFLLGVFSHALNLLDFFTDNITINTLRLVELCSHVLDVWLYGVSAYIVLGLNSSSKRWYRTLVYVFSALHMASMGISWFTEYQAWASMTAGEQNVEVPTVPEESVEVSVIIMGAVDILMERVWVGFVAVLVWELRKRSGEQHVATAEIARIARPTVAILAGQCILEAYTYTYAYDFGYSWIALGALRASMEMLVAWGICRALQAARREDYSNSDGDGEVRLEKAERYRDEE